MIKAKNICLFILLSLMALGVNPVFADPPPQPVNPQSILLPVFCFRVTDIQAVGSDLTVDTGDRLSSPDSKKDDNATGRFRITVEVLNWTNQKAFGLYMAVNGAAGVSGARPTLVDAGVTADGSTRAAISNDLLQQRSSFTNGSMVNDFSTGYVADSGATSVLWTAGSNGGINNRDLLNSPITKATVNTFNGQVIAGPSNLPPGISSADATNDNFKVIDDSDNVLDGFYIEVDNFLVNGALSINWWLLDVNGNPLGTTVQGNPMSFGTFNLARIDTTNPITPPLVGNTGYTDAGNLFYDGAQDGFDAGGGNFFSNADLRRGINFDALPTSASREKFVGEIGVAVTAPFLTAQDATINVTGTVLDTGQGDPAPDLGTTVNLQVQESIIVEPDPEPGNTNAVPEPNTIFLFALIALGLFGRKVTKK